MDSSEDLDVKTLIAMLAERLRERVVSNPVSTLGGAAAVGYMLGWSMPTPLYRGLAGMAVRSVLMQVLGNVVANFREDLGLLGEDDDDLDLDLAEGGSSAGQARGSDPSPYVA